MTPNRPYDTMSLLRFQVSLLGLEAAINPSAPGPAAPAALDEWPTDEIERPRN